MRLIGLSDADTVRLIEADRSQTEEAEYLESDLNVKVKEKMAAPRRRLLRCIKIMLAISVLGTLFVVVRVHFLNGDSHGVVNFSQLFVQRVHKIDDVVKVKLSDSSISFADSVTGHFLKVKLTGDAVNNPPDLDSCSKILGNADPQHAKEMKLGVDPFVRSVCLKWKDTMLIVNDTRERGSLCYSVHWTTSQRSSPENCVSMSGAHWYGGSLLSEHQWPLEEVSIPMQPFISSPLNVFKSTGDSGDYGPVLERMWINSLGFGIIGDSDDPLHVSINAHQQAHLCLKAQAEGYDILKSSKTSPLTLKYTVCMDRTAKYVHGHLMKKFLTLPKEAPSGHLMQDPVWSTRGINMNNLTQEQVLDLKINITDNKFLHSQFHIAGNVSRNVGGLFLDHDRFPNSHQMIGEMKFEGFNVSTSLLPVMETGVYDFKEGTKLGYFVDLAKNQTGQWKDKTLALIDFTNPEACKWMTKRLASFKTESSVSGFYFDSGEAVVLSRSRPTHVPLPSPCDYSKYYVKFAHSLSNNSIVAVGYRSQEFPVMVDIGARDSSWSHQLGLKSVIPSVLTLGLLGYPFLVVGPVGGVPVDHVDKSNNRFSLPDEELYIRWLQLSVFLPGLEMSVGPWMYGEKVVEIARSLLKHRAERVVPVIQTAVKEFLHTGAPIIRPLWWMATEDEVAQRIDCEFLVSNKILVAPVLQPGARRRDVYLPKVKDLKWKDVLRGDVYTGGQWLRGFKVELSEVATFVPVYKSQSDFHLIH